MKDFASEDGTLIVMQPAVTPPPPPTPPSERPRSRLSLKFLIVLVLLLGVAAMEAQRNNYANATAAAREFFDGCTALAQTEAFAEEPRTGNAVASYAAQRDAIMTQLANADPLVKERLAGMYLAVDGVFTRRQ